VSNNLFTPPPKVNSAVISLKRKKNINLNCDEKLFLKIVKLSFQQRRKTIRNSLKQINLSENLREHTIFDKRPEQLSVDQFIDLTNLINQDLKH
jgi:16S rRNA (adenine1518-N6/adenine1519-N6)-dimethyltransferase